MNINRTTEEDILDFAVSQGFARSWDAVGLKLAEEAGEVVVAVVKIQEGRAPLGDLEAEIGDVLIVLSQMAAWLGTSLEELRERRFEQIRQRACKS